MGDDLLFETSARTHLAEQLRTRVWVLVVAKSWINFQVRIHELRHAHAAGLLAGGSDVKAVMDRMGHVQIQTTQKYPGARPE